MRVVAMVVLALGAASCASRSFDLVPRETSASSLATPHWVWTESTQSSVGASYERYWLDHLLFEVEVVNQSDSMLVVDPGQFALTVVTSSSGKRAKERVQRISPASAATVETRIVRESGVGPDLTDVVLGAVCFTFAAAIVATLTAMGEPADVGSALGENRPAVWEIRRVEAARTLERLGETLFHRTELAPGQSVRGQLWFPARHLQRVIGPRVIESQRNAASITRFTAARPDVHCAMKLEAPAALGGQELDYFVWAE